MVKNSPANAGLARDEASISGSQKSPGVGNVTHSSIPTWEIRGTEEPNRLQFVGLQRVGKD